MMSLPISPDVPLVDCSNIDKATSNSADPRQTKMLFNEVAKLEGPWLRSRHEIKKDRYQEKNNARTDSRASIHKRSLALKAAVPERGCTLYLQHIHMPPVDEAQHVIASIRSYVRDSFVAIWLLARWYGLPSMGKSTAKKVAAPGPQE